jgi:hypothetical protein
MSILLDEGVRQFRMGIIQTPFAISIYSVFLTFITGYYKTHQFKILEKKEIDSYKNQNMNMIKIRFLFLGVLLMLFFTRCNSSSQSRVIDESSEYKNETSDVKELEYYELEEKSFQDDNGTVIKIKLPKEVNVINGWDNTVVQYEWFSNGSRNIISIDKTESSNTITYLDDDKKYHDDIEEFWENEWKKDLNEVKKVLPPFYTDVRMISFEPKIIINGKYYFRRQLYCKDTRLSETKFNDKDLIEIQYITLHNKRKYMVTYRYYGGDKGISDVIGQIHTIGGSIQIN